MKQKISDFACALVITMGVLVCLALVSGTDFFDEAVEYDREHNTIEIFGTSMMVNEKAFETVRNIFYFNDNIFGHGFSQRAEKISKAISGYVGDGMKTAFGLAKAAVGAR